MNLSLRPLAAVIACTLGLTLAACGSDSDEGGGADGDATTITVGTQQPSDALQVQMAIEAGYFEDAGITDVQVRSFSALPAMFAAAEQGQIDIALGAFVALNGYNAASSGAQMRYVVTNGFNSTAWMSANDDSLLTWQDTQDTKKIAASWKGKRIGIPAPGGVLDFYTRYMLRQADLDPDKDVTWVTIQPGAATVSAFEEDLVDVVGMDNSTLAAVVDAGVGRSAIHMAGGEGPEELLDLLSVGYFADESRISEDTELYESFRVAITETKAYMADPANKDDVLGVLSSDKIGLGSIDAELLYKTVLPQWTTGDLEVATLDKTREALITTGMIKSPGFEYEDVVSSVASEK